MTVAMRRSSDCGPVAMANHLEDALGMDAGGVYSRIMSQFGFPSSDGLVADLWDSPPRHFAVIRSIVGKPPGIDPALAMQPGVVLLKLSTTDWHWVTVLRSQPGESIRFHDGLAIRTNMTIDTRFPGCKIELVYTVNRTTPLPWYWSPWAWFTAIFAGGLS